MSTAPSSSRPRRVLLVEDDLDQAHLVRFLLEEDGRFTVTLAQDGLRGSLLVRDSPWDLVITDLNLPGADGMAVVEASKKHQPETPILATTGYAGPEYADRALQKGADEILMKPLERETFLARVDALVNGPPPATGAADDLLRVLAVSVRPGDAEAGCGATLLRHRDRGDRVVLLTLTHGTPGEGGLHRRDQAKEAGRAMGIRFFVGNAGSGDAPVEEDLARLVRGALAEIRPDLLYLPTRNHPAPELRRVHETALEDGDERRTIIAYDPGDASPGFRPDLFVPVGAVLEEKLRVLELFEAEEGTRLHPESVRVGARFWARYGTGEATEALESIRGAPLMARSFSADGTSR